MTSAIHDAVPRFFAETVFHDIREWLAVVAPRLRVSCTANTAIVFPDGRTNVPDWGFKIRNPGFNNRFPELVIEAGYSQSRPALRRAARRWLCRSAGGVKVVVLIRFRKPMDLQRFCDVKAWTGWAEVHVRASAHRYVGPLNCRPAK